MTMRIYMPNFITDPGEEGDAHLAIYLERYKNKKINLN